MANLFEPLMRGWKRRPGSQENCIMVIPIQVNLALRTGRGVCNPARRVIRERERGERGRESDHSEFRIRFGSKILAHSDGFQNAYQANKSTKCLYHVTICTKAVVESVKCRAQIETALTRKDPEQRTTLLMRSLRISPSPFPASLRFIFHKAEDSAANKMAHNIRVIL